MFGIHETLYWEHLGLAGALTLSLFVLVGLAMRLREPAPRMHIWAMIGFFTVNLCDNLNAFAYSDVFDGLAAFARWNDVLIPGFMVALYFYVRALTSATPRLTRSDVVHLIPFTTAIVCLAPLLILPGDQRIGRAKTEVSELHLTLIDWGETLFWVFWILWLTLYAGLCIQRLIRHKRNVRALFSDLEGRTLLWLDALVAVILILTMIVVVDEIRDLMGLSSIRDGVFSMLYDIVLPFSFGIFALRASPVLPGWTEPVLAEPEPETVPQTETQTEERSAEPERYARSGLTAEDLARYATRLEKRMEEGQLWRDHGLNLRGLAAAISIAPIHLSEVLNTKLGMTFYDYVNQCRIRDACDLLINSDAGILEISETVGFNAKSTFNTSFKKVTEQTPSQWRARHRP